jgi:hypothetical protein
MNASNKSFGRSTLAGLFAVAALASAVPAFASTTTVTWDFFGGSGANQDIGPSATFTGDPSTVPGVGTITAYGEASYSTTVSTATYQLLYSQDKNRLYYGRRKDSTTTSSGSTATDLYNKYQGVTENGLGLSGYTDGEIGDKGTVVSSTSYSGGQDNYNYYHSNEYKTVTKTITSYTGMIQLDLANLLSLATSGATITIGSLSTTSKDVAVFTGSNALGDIGSSVGNPLKYTSSGANGSETLSLSALTDPGTNKYYQYLNISVQSPGQSVLLSSLSLTFPSNPGNPTPAAPAPVPASAGLTLAGALGMGMMLLARRRRSML